MGAHIRSSYKTVALAAALCCGAMLGHADVAAATAPHGFAGGVPTHGFKGEVHHAQAMHHRHFPQGQFAGDGMPVYLSGSFAAEPYDEGENYGDGGPYAYPFPYPPPYAMRAMPPPCVTPLVIELGAHHQAKMPKVTYGSSPGACPPPIVEAKH